MITTEAALLMLAFGCVLSYCAGRADTRDLGPMRRHPQDLDSLTVLELHRHAARRKAPRRRG